MCLLFIHPHYSLGQVVSTPPAESDPVEPLQIKLSVNEVMLDVVVLDRRGNPITDLTAKDFEVTQNGARQNVLSSVYIGNQTNQTGITANPSVQSSVSLKGDRNLPPLPTVDLTREDTRRTIIIVIDDLSMGFKNVNHARTAVL